MTTDAVSDTIPPCRVPRWEGETPVEPHPHSGSVATIHATQSNRGSTGVSPSQSVRSGKAVPSFVPPQSQINDQKSQILPDFSLFSVFSLFSPLKNACN